MLPAGKLDKISRISLKTRCYTKPELSQLNKLPPKRPGGRRGGSPIYQPMWNAQLMTFDSSLYWKLINFSPIHQIKLIKWVVQMIALFPDTLRSDTLAYIYFVIAYLQVNNCYNPSLASLHLSHDKSRQCQWDTARTTKRRLKQKFISSFFKKNKLAVSIWNTKSIYIQMSKLNYLHYSMKRMLMRKL